MVSHTAEHGIQTQHQGASCPQHSNLISIVHAGVACTRPRMKTARRGISVGIRWNVKKSTAWSLVCVFRLKQFGGHRNAGKVLRSQWVHRLQPHHTHISIQLFQVMHRVA
jgi:hypothetical protein